MTSRTPTSVFTRSVIRQAAAPAVETLERRQVFASGLAAVVDAGGNLTIDNTLIPSQTLYKSGRALARGTGGNAGTIAKSYLKSHAADFGLQTADVTNAIITDQYKDADTGISHVYLRQTIGGLPIIGADMNVTVMADGSVTSATGRFLPNLIKYARGVRGPKVNAGGALVNAAAQLGLDDNGVTYKTRSSSATGAFRTVLSAPKVAKGDVAAEIRYVLTATGLKKVWNFAVQTLGQDHWYNVAVGGDKSEVVYAADWVDNAQYNVIARPAASPPDGGFTVVTDSQDAVSSPYGWHDTNGAAGGEFTDTRGNNVDAHLDRIQGTDADIPDGTRPDGGASLNFTGANFSQLPGSEPTVAINQNVAQVNLFYANNTMHDIMYRYGFTPAAGNFQTNTYGNGGIGNDAVQADAQDGGGTNNANFATPPDGTAGRMQMYLFTAPTPDRDGDLDMEVVYHEYGHGVTNRLTGGPSNSDALNALQSGGMGEGWSDFFALMLTQKTTDAQTTSQPVGTYVLAQAPTASGIRRFPYNYNMAVNPLTVDAYGGSGTGGGTTRSLEVHNTGEIWTSVLWDMNWNLINKYGFNTDLQNGFNPANIKGNDLALKLVMDALKLQPANPSFKDARDAILQADANLHATLGTPSNAAEIWAAFARRGMGTAFVDRDAASDAVTASFTTPVADPTVTSPLPSATFGTTSTIDVRFDQPMNTASFSIAGDLVSLTGPNGNDLTGTVSGFTWTDSTTLRLNLSTAPTVRGNYTLVVGPQILAADDGHAMDSNRNGVPGEAVADRATLTVQLIDKIGPDGFGYQTAPTPFENINLVPGAAGVTTLNNTGDDTASAVNLGANTFNMYGTSYTGAASLFASTNGLITLGTGNTSYFNDPLDGSSATQRSIAPLWADFRNDVNPGATDSAILYQVDTANNRLIIEWSDVGTYYGSGGASTFQAILQLNTGATPGRIIYNYVDADVGGTSPFGGVGTTGIKTTGTPGNNRLLLNVDYNNPWIATGRAVVTALDVTGPKVSAEAFNFVANQSFSVTFSEDVGASLSVADFVLTNTTTGTVVPSADLSYAYNSGTRTATLTKTGGLLTDGNYSLTINAAGVTDASGNLLDGNADNVIGGNHAFSTFVLAGDIDRDRGVSINDFNILAANFGKASGQSYLTGDFDYDGGVSINDFNLLAGNFGKTI